MKTFLAIIALTAGFTAQAVTLPLIGLPLKPAPQKLAVKAAGTGKKLTAGMGFGAGVPYLCTGTRYECGLTDDNTDVTPVVNIDTGLRDIVQATAHFALDSSGNVYRRGNIDWDSRPDGVQGETVEVSDDGRYTSGAYAGALSYYTNSICSPGLTGALAKCVRLPATHGADWQLIQNGANCIFEPMGKPMGYATASEYVVWDPAALIRSDFRGGDHLSRAPGDTCPVAGFYNTAAGDIVLIESRVGAVTLSSGQIAGISSGHTVSSSAMIALHNRKRGHPASAGTYAVSRDFMSIYVTTADAGRRVQATVYNWGGVPTNRNDWATGTLTRLSIHSGSAGDPYLNLGATTLGQWATLSGSLNSTVFELVVPGTGDIHELYTLPTSDPHSPSQRTIYLRTTTGETWQLEYGAGRWVKL